MVYLIVLLLLLGVACVISAPLRRARSPDERAALEGASDTLRLDLEAARDAKLRELRDAELDHQTGKLSDEDYDAIDSTLRAEAVALLHELDELETPEESDD